MATAGTQTVNVTSSTSDVWVPPSVTLDSNTPYREIEPALTLTADPMQVFSVTATWNGQNVTVFGSKKLNPMPRLAYHDYIPAMVGDPGFTLTIDGAGFVLGAEIQFDGRPLATTYISPTQLRADIASTDLTAGIHLIHVVNPSPGGGESDDMSIWVDKDEVYIDSIRPNRVLLGSPDTVVLVYGDVFTSNSVVRLDGIERATTFIGRSQLKFTLTASELASAGQHSVTVYDSRNGGMLSNEAIFSVVANTPPTGEVEDVGSEFNGSRTMGTRAMVVVKGWMADYEDNSGMTVFLRYDNQTFNTSPSSLNTNQDRPDIAVRFGRPEWGKSGFTLRAAGNAPGTHTVQLIAKDRDEATTVLPFLHGMNTVTFVDAPQPTGIMENVIGADGTLAFTPGMSVFVSGWAAMPSGESPAAVRIYWGDILHPIGDAQIGIRRPDLAAAKGSAFGSSGFAFQFKVPADAQGLMKYVMVQAYNSVGDAVILGSVLTSIVAGTPDISVLSPSSASLAFGPQFMGEAGAAQILTLTNTGGLDARIFSIGVSGPFSLTHSCPSILAVASLCSISTTYSATALRTQMGALLIYSNSLASPQVIPLFGRGDRPLVPSRPLRAPSHPGAPPPVSAASNLATSAPAASPREQGSESKTNRALASAYNEPPSNRGNALELLGETADQSATSKSVHVGETATYTLRLVASSNFSGSAEISCSGGPQNSTCTVEPSSVNLTANSSTLLNVRVTTSTGAAGNYPVVITATGGGENKSANISLRVE